MRLEADICSSIKIWMPQTHLPHHQYSTPSLVVCFRKYFAWEVVTLKPNQGNHSVPPFAFTKKVRIDAVIGFIRKQTLRPDVGSYRKRHLANCFIRRWNFDPLPLYFITFSNNEWTWPLTRGLHKKMNLTNNHFDVNYSR